MIDQSLILEAFLNLHPEKPLTTNHDRARHMRASLLGDGGPGEEFTCEVKKGIISSNLLTQAIWA